MTRKHSPGPWAYKEHGSQIVDAREGSQQTLVATVAINTYRDEGSHNARLIAAAPDMLNALQVAIMWSDPDWVGHEIVTAAVAKAVGHKLGTGSPGNNGASLFRNLVLY